MSKPRFAIVKSQYRPDIVGQLLKGAAAALDAAGAAYDVVEVAGSLEIPAAVAMLDAGRKRYDGYVALGCLMKGETIHDEVIAHAIFPALDQLARDRLLPIGNGVLTVASEAQALDRADPARQNRGGEAAQAALRMLQIKQTCAA